MIPQAWHDEFQTAIRAIAPELERVYILTHPSHLPRPACSAYCPLVVNPLLEKHLQAIGEWRGPGEMLVFVDEPRSLELALPIVLHELSHCLPKRPAIHEPEPTPELLQANFRAYQKMAVTMRDATRPPWHGHGLSFIRTAIHVCFRAVWHRRHPLLDLESMTVAGGTYGLSPARYYKQALGDEPASMLGSTFADILSTPPPETFTMLFQDDTARWQKGNVA